LSNVVIGDLAGAIGNAVSLALACGLPYRDATVKATLRPARKAVTACANPVVSIVLRGTIG
jgi:hypothetical protein